MFYTYYFIIFIFIYEFHFAGNEITEHLFSHLLFAIIFIYFV